MEFKKKIALLFTDKYLRYDESDILLIIKHVIIFSLVDQVTQLVFTVYTGHINGQYDIMHLHSPTHR